MTTEVKIRVINPDGPQVVPCTPAPNNGGNVCEFNTWAETVQMCITAGAGSASGWYKTDNGVLP